MQTPLKPDQAMRLMGKLRGADGAVSQAINALWEADLEHSRLALDLLKCRTSIQQFFQGFTVSVATSQAAEVPAVDHPSTTGDMSGVAPNQNPHAHG